MNGLDEQEFCDEIKLDAENDGDCYARGDADLAIARAFAAFQMRRREEEAAVFAINQAPLVRELAARWKKTRKS